MLRIVTNAIWDFRVDNDEICFEKLKNYNDYDCKIDAIVLMCEKILSVHGMEMMKVITDYVKTFPNNIPCFLVGIKSNIKNQQYLKYKHAERDFVIKEFLEEILKKSKSVGVCDKLTRKWLIEYFKYDEDKIDLIINEKSPRNRNFLISFLKKNGADFLLDPFTLREILRFHNNRGKICFDYLRKECTTLGKDITSEIVIKKPRLESKDDKSILSADIVVDGNVRNIWLETDFEYRGYLDLKTCDAFVVAVLPFAIRTEHDIRCEIPVSEQLLHNIEEELLPNMHAGDKRIYKSKIIADTVSLKTCGDGVAVGFSAGVDSFYSLYHYLEGVYSEFKPNYLFTGNYGLNSEMMKAVHGRVDKVAEESGLKAVKTNTNVSEVFPELIHIYVHFFKIFFGVIALRSLFKTYIYSTTYMANEFNLSACGNRDTAYYELLLIRCFSYGDFLILDGGADVERMEKTSELVKFPISYDNLNVCVKPQLKKNCGVCGKCLRTLLTLDSLGALEKYKDSFDIEQYIRNRTENLKYLIRNKEQIFLKPIYQSFCVKEKQLIEQIESMIRESGD